MKMLKYLTTIVSIIFLASCEKHDIKFAGEQEMDSNMAELRLHYVEPVGTTSAAANQFDSLYINGVLYANHTNTFGVFNVMPNSNKFYIAKPGTVNIKCWRGGVDPIYDFDIEAKKGKQDVFIYDIEKAPKVLPFEFPLKRNYTANVPVFDTDSVAYVEFYNFLYEDYGTNKVPYTGTLQCEYQDSRTQEWIKVGEPVAFGEQGGRVPVKVIKEDHISQGSQVIPFRMVTSDNKVLMYTNNKGAELEWNNNFTLTIGRGYMFYACGIRTSATINTAITTKTIH